MSVLKPQGAESNELKSGDFGRVEFEIRDDVRLERTTWNHPNPTVGASREEALQDPFYRRQVHVVGKYFGIRYSDPSVTGSSTHHTSIRDAALYVRDEMKKHPKPQGKDIGDGYGYVFHEAQSDGFNGGGRPLLNHERQALLLALPHTPLNKEEQVAIEIKTQAQKTGAAAKQVAGISTIAIPVAESTNWNAAVRQLAPEEKDVILRHIHAMQGRAENIFDSVQRAQLPAEKFKHSTEPDAISVKAVMDRVNMVIDTRELDAAIKASGKFTDNARALFWCRMLVR